MKNQKFFNSTIELFEKYRAKMSEEEPEGYNVNLANEVHKRLQQLSFIYEKVRSYEQQAVTLGPVSENIEAYEKIFLEMEIYVEAFYYFADRIRSILRHKKTNLFPYLNKFEAKGVRTVRNELIEHPETAGVTLVQSFGCGGNRGPVLKSVKLVRDTFDIQDQGLWTNAEEFKSNLEKLLLKALK